MKQKKQFIQAKTLEGFQTALSSGKVSENQVGFIEKEDLIWAKGKYYGVIPNEEDISKDSEGKLQLADRPYDEAKFSGKGYKILRKNIQNVANYDNITNYIEINSISDDSNVIIEENKYTEGEITNIILNTALNKIYGKGEDNKFYTSWTDDIFNLNDYILNNSPIINKIYKIIGTFDFYKYTESGFIKYNVSENHGLINKNVILNTDFNKENTVYIIRYDFDLGGKEIELPEGCVLKFEGGSLSNGILSCNKNTTNEVDKNAKIIAENSDYIFKNMEFLGRFDCIVYAEWFGAKYDDKSKAGIGSFSDVTPSCLNAYKLVICTNQKILTFAQKQYHIKTWMNFKRINNVEIKIHGLSSITSLTFTNSILQLITGNFFGIEHLLITPRGSTFDGFNFCATEQVKMFYKSRIRGNESDYAVKNCKFGMVGYIFYNCDLGARAIIGQSLLGSWYYYCFYGCQCGDGAVHECYIHGGYSAYDDPDKRCQMSIWAKNTQFTMFDLINSWIEFTDMRALTGNVTSCRSVNNVYDYCYYIGTGYSQVTGCAIFHFKHETIKNNILWFSQSEGGHSTEINPDIENIPIFNCSNIVGCTLNESSMDEHTYLFYGYYNDTYCSLTGYNFDVGVNQIQATNPENICYEEKINNRPYFNNKDGLNIKLPYKLSKLFIPSIPGLHAYLGLYNTQAISNNTLGNYYEWFINDRISGYELIDTFTYEGKINNSWNIFKVSDDYSFEQGIRYILQFKVKTSTNTKPNVMLTGAGGGDIYTYVIKTETLNGPLSIKVDGVGQSQYVSIEAKIFKFTGIIENYAIIDHIGFKVIGFITEGTMKGRPILNENNIGFEYYDTTLDNKIIWDGSEWRNEDGTLVSKVIIL